MKVSLLSFTMSVSSGDDGSILECAARGPSLAAEFRAVIDHGIMAGNIAC